MSHLGLLKKILLLAYRLIHLRMLASSSRYAAILADSLLASELLDKSLDAEHYISEKEGIKLKVSDAFFKAAPSCCEILNASGDTVFQSCPLDSTAW